MPAVARTPPMGPSKVEDLRTSAVSTPGVRVNKPAAKTKAVSDSRMVMVGLARILLRGLNSAFTLKPIHAPCLAA